MSARVVVLRGRTSDRSPAPARGAQALGEAVAARLGTTAAAVGEPAPPREQQWEQDLREGREAIAAAADALGEALDAGRFPVLFAAECSIAVGTLPLLARREPTAHVVWLDAHADFNTPATTESGYLGGMCLAAACGRWDGGFGGELDARRVVLSDARALDPPERTELDRSGARLLPPAAVADAVRGERVFLHLDVDVLDPEIVPAGVPAPHGLTLEALRSVVAELAGAAELVGVEVTAFAVPEEEAERTRLTQELADVVALAVPRHDPPA